MIYDAPNFRDVTAQKHHRSIKLSCHQIIHRRQKQQENS
jgi:hypothetical protein